VVTCDLSDILPEEVEEAVKSAAEISMGTEISQEDVENISYLCEEVLADLLTFCAIKNHL
jgi:nucleolar protein 58